MRGAIIAGVVLLAVAGTAGGQEPVTRAAAMAAAESHGSRIALARADTSASAAALATARMLENPVAVTSYTKSTPQYHAEVALPLDFLWLRGPRVRAAGYSLGAARLRFQLERASAAFDADTAYTAAQAAAAHSRLSARNAQDADSLLHMATVRRDAGDASDLDVQLAAVSAGQAHNTATGDSLAAIAAVLDLQAIMGLAADRVSVQPADSLTLPALDSLPAQGIRLLPVAAAEAALAAEEQSIVFARRGVLAAPSLSVGFETGDPSGGETGVLPLVGVTLPLPIFNRNGGPIAAATATRDRARAELDLAKRASAAARARALRNRESAFARAERDRALVTTAERVAVLSLRAYAEGAFALPSVLEARRAARETLSQYIDDLAAANDAAAALRLLTLVVPAP
ncbi:MAG: TolC family protein [Gemmatimonadota bacterium]